jgi:hypothetical protein
VYYPLDSGRSFGDIEWSAVNQRLARSFFSAIPGAAIVVADAPSRIVGWSGDHTDFVATLGKPNRHFAGVLANPR